MKRGFSDYGMVVVLILLCLLFSVLTFRKESATGSSSAKSIIRKVESTLQKSDVIFVVGEIRKESGEFASKVFAGLEEKGFNGARFVVGSPKELRTELALLDKSNGKLRAIVASGNVPEWGVVSGLSTDFPGLGKPELIIPKGKWRSGFLSPSNFVAIISRVVPIAVVAIGMTLVILTGGIDLSVGSLIALAAVVSALIISGLGGKEASGLVVLLGFLGAIFCCGCVGAISGWLVSHFKVAPFITTLAFMMMVRGAAKQITGGFTIESLPDSMRWLGQGSTLGIPNTILILIILYLVAHFFMTRTRFGRYIYAVGGNEEAARLSGVPVKGIIIFVYVVCGLCAGLGGCIQASQIKVGTPNIGVMFELYVIAAVVVGGTSLSGGSGRIMGTLVGALIIAVIQNGMNFMGLKQFTQDIVLGAVLLFAVLLNRGSLRISRKLG